MRLKKIFICVFVFCIMSVLSVGFVSAETSLIGDVNGDGVVNIADATLIQKYTIKLENITELTLADVNGDGVVNIKDATKIQKDIVNIQETTVSSTEPTTNDVIHLPFVPAKR